MNLSKKERRELKNKIVEILSEVTVFPIDDEESLDLFTAVHWSITNNFFPKMRQLSYPLSKHAKETFAGLFGTSGPFDLLINKVSSELSNRQWNPHLTDEAGLTNFLSHDDTASLAEKIISSLESYPRRYRIFLPLGKSADIIISYDFNNTISITGARSELKSKYMIPTSSDEAQTTHLNPTVSERLLDFWSDEQNYLSIILEGYLSNYEEGVFRVTCEDKIYSVIGLALAVEALAPEYYIPRYKGYGSDQDIPISFPVFDLSQSDSPVFIKEIILPDAAKGLIQGIGWPSTQQDKLHILGSILSCLDSNSRLTESAKRILGASRWYFDTISEHNQTHAFIQSMVGLEILLGDQHKKSNLVDRLTDRVAYLLAESMITREDLRHDFGELYTLRSKIIHGGAVFLPPKQADRLGSAQGYLKKIINVEATNFASYLDQQDDSKRNPSN